jgi:hypothetical protein
VCSDRSQRGRLWSERDLAVSCGRRAVGSSVSSGSATRLQIWPPHTCASGEAKMVSDSKIERREPMPLSSFVSGEPPTPAPSRYGIGGPKGAVGILLYLALIGFVAAGTIGIFFGAGFSLLAPPSAIAVVDPGAPKRADGDAALADRAIEPVSRETAASGSAAIAAIPGLLAQPPIGSSAQVSPTVPPVIEPFSETRLVPDPASGQLGSLAPGMQAGPAAFATASTGLFSERADQGGHTDQNTPVGVRQDSDRLTAGRQSAHRHHKRAEKPAAFDKLITQLTGEANSVDQELTPPRASLSPPGISASHARR